MTSRSAMPDTKLISDGLFDVLNIIAVVKRADIEKRSGSDWIENW